MLLLSEACQQGTKLLSLEQSLQPNSLLKLPLMPAVCLPQGAPQELGQWPSQLKLQRQQRQQRQSAAAAAAACAVRRAGLRRWRAADWCCCRRCLAAVCLPLRLTCAVALAAAKPLLEAAPRLPGMRGGLQAAQAPAWPLLTQPHCHRCLARLQLCASGHRESCELLLPVLLLAPGPLHAARPVVGRQSYQHLLLQLQLQLH